ncbi:L-2-hydroxyglutarate oxidase [Nocardia flavorosea]|uniref:L-2-hydroxyglutarate oxidase n=1 Tax=Nocardia flavorosea TaxID=53429 RepID=A0A846YRK0_9NOCA|nr:L-2-hydroxyglutarate oxidase [Nocardia flavorosea]NKY59599.1 L-2-hydroxyglutarate oxidase [Nocardia flavorosea]
MADRMVVVVGAGIVGLAVAREIGRRRPGDRVVVLEKEDRVAAHQTGHNSGVVHAGIYYQPGSLKAVLCARGRAMLRDYCAERGLPYEECGKLVIAVDDAELARLDDLEVRAGHNAVPGLHRVDAAGIRDIEPFAEGIAALYSPHTAITDFRRVAEAFATDIVAAGGEVRTSCPVDRITRTSSGIEVAVGEQVLPADRVVLCAGLQADTVAALAGAAAGPRIVPFRGEYMEVMPEKRDLVRGLVYPVPDPRYPFLGVHFTRRISGTVEVGPNAVLAFAREGYRRTRLVPRDMAKTLAWPGFRRMVRQHWRTGLEEMYGSVSIAAYMRKAQRYIPAIGTADVVRAGAGVRAQALDADGALVDDFRIDRLGPVTAVRNAPSPAATSSLAIAEYVVDVIDGKGEHTLS